MNRYNLATYPNANTHAQQRVTKKKKLSWRGNEMADGIFITPLFAFYVYISSI